MKTITEHLDNISFNNMVNEDFLDPHLRKLTQQLHKDGDRFNQYFGPWSIRWDQVDSSLVKEYPVTKDIDSIIRKNKPCFVIGIKDGEYKFFIDPSFDYRAFKHDWNDYRPKQSEIFDKCHKCDSILIIDYNKAREDAGSVELQSDRQASREGMWLRNKDDFEKRWGIKDYDDWCKEIASENIERYKKLIAQAHALKDDGFDKISDRIQSLLQRAMQLSVDLSKGKTSLEGKSYEVRQVLGRFYGDTYWDSARHQSSGSKGVIKLVAEYLDTKTDLRKGVSYDPTRSEKYLKTLIDHIVTLCDSIEAAIKKLEG